MNNWRDFTYGWTNLFFFSQIGHPRQWICIKSTTTTKTKTYDPTTTTGSNTHSVPLAMLCGGWAFVVRSDMENTPSAITIPTTIVRYIFLTLFYVCVYFLYRLSSILYFQYLQYLCFIIIFKLFNFFINRL